MDFKRPTKEEAKAIIKSLALKFQAQHTQFTETKSTYKEASVRADFIDEFIIALGWDFKNNLGLPQFKREVIVEDSINVENSVNKKESDYTFNINGTKQFFIEAKKPSLLIRTHKLSAYQLRYYSYSAKLPIGFVTDFEELAVFDCTIQPNKDDKVERPFLIDYFIFSEYVSKFDQIWDYLSYESVSNKKLLELAKTKTKQRGNSTLDTDFVNSLNEWREVLARNIFKNNPHITTDDLNFAVQNILDRIIFLRVCEDRKIEPDDQLRGVLVSKGNAYKTLVQDFKKAASRYNSDLFNFTRDTITANLNISDETVKTIIDGLYDSPYAFNYIPVEILGNAYERFLGKTISIDRNHKIEIDDKPEVRKAGGVFYTPQYIVNYIVENTVGKLVEGKTPEKVAALRILDPSCGSGSFLLGVYQFLLDWHVDYYKKNPKYVKTNLKPYNSDGSLTNVERKRILLNNVYGVDLDAQAVEVTKLSLLLKALEGETAASVKQLATTSERVLPSLDLNIRCGNSLVAGDVKKGDPSVSKAEIEDINPFDWETAFRKIIVEEGGFDAVVGNPPYGAELSANVQSYLAAKFPIGNTDTAAVFMVKTQQDWLKKGGFNGFIIPKAFTYASNWEKTRNKLLEDITLIVDCSKVWKEVKLEMTLYISRKESKQKSFTSLIRQGEQIVEVGQIDKKLCGDFGFILNGVSNDEIEIGLKVKQQSKNLNSFTINKQGIPNQKYTQETKSDYKVIGGAEISRYNFKGNIKGFISKKYIDNDCAFLKENSVYVQRIVAHVANPVPHIKIIATTIDNIKLSDFVIVNTVIQLINSSDYSKYFILGILNSHLVSWYAYRFIFANAIRTMQFYNPTTERIPFPDLDLSKKTDKKAHDAIVQHVESILELKTDLSSATSVRERERLEKKIADTEGAINALVYQLYDITDKADIQLIEGK